MKYPTLLLLICMFAFQPVQEAKTKYVSAKSGLRMRDRPELSGEKLSTIPYNASVSAVENIEGMVFLADTYGEWTKVIYNGEVGWVFGGYLSDVQPATNTGSAVLSQDFVDFYTQQVGKEPALCRIDFEGYGYYTDKDGVVRPGLLNEETGVVDYYEYNLEHTYHFEKGVSVIHNEGYEWGGLEYKFPTEHFELKDVFDYAALVYRYKFVDYLDVIDGIPQMPTAKQNYSRTEEYVEKSYSVEMYGNNFVSLRIEESEVCGESWFFEVRDDFFVFGNHGGC
ncbi:MAG: SH3 domain-containing protein [Cyclobacteriaceae bacterium]